MVDGHEKTDSFLVNNFFGLRHFFDPWYFKKDQKMAGTKNFFVSKNQFCHAHQPWKGIFEICFVFSDFFVRASNGSHYSNFVNKYPKLGTDTPEDMLFTNLAEATWSSEIGIALILTYTQISNDCAHVLLFRKNSVLKTTYEAWVSSSLIFYCSSLTKYVVSGKKIAQILFHCSKIK